MRHTGTSSSLPGQVRAARRRQALTQAGLAERSGVSRVTIARLEAGSPQDLRVGTLSRLCDALGLEFLVAGRNALATLEVRLARERERGRRLDLRRRHASLAARLLVLPREEAGALIGRARQVVERWASEELCSQHYVSRWRAMLSGPRKRVAGALLHPGTWADALFQNSPWSFALDPPAA